MTEEFCIAAFRSRQQVMAFERDLRQHGVRASVMITPRAVAMGCGLSVRIEREDLRRAVQVYRTTNPGNLIGFYDCLLYTSDVWQEPTGRTTVRPAGIE